jgi:Flp pilus assembly protein TadD
MPRLIGLLLCVALSCPAAVETTLILPFFNSSKSKNIDWIGDSISESFFEAFASCGQLAIHSENRDEVIDSMGLRRGARLTQGSVMEVAINLGAGLVVFGEYDLKSPAPGNSGKWELSVKARLVNVRQTRKIKDLAATGPLEELSFLQTHLAWQALTAAGADAGIQESAFRAAHPPIRFDALESYVRGLIAPGEDQKQKLFATAARIEPGFSQPCYQLGRLHFDKDDYAAASEWLKKVQPGDAHYRESLFLLGISRFRSSDFTGARDAFRVLASAVPLSEVWNNLGAAQIRASDPGALASLQKALEINESDPDYHFNLGYALWKQGDFERAAASFRAVLERSREDADATLMLGRCIKKAGPRPGELRVEELERLKENYDESAWLHLRAVLNPQKQ